MNKKIFDEWVKVPLIITVWAIILIGLLAIGQVIGETKADELDNEYIDAVIMDETAILNKSLQLQQAEIQDLKEQLENK